MIAQTAAKGQIQEMSDATRTLHSGLLASAPLRHIEYQYDTWNNVTVRDDLVNGIDEQFDYDRLDRLTATTLSSDRHLGNIEISQSQSYDVYGNIVTKSDVGSYQYDAARPHAVSQAGDQQYSYDANGNLLNGNQRSFTWNSNNKPTRIEQGTQWVTFDYGPNRSRYKKTNHQGDTTWYVGQLYEKTISDDDTQHQHHIYAGSNLVAIHSVSEDNDDGTKVNNTRYLHKDALGSIDTLTDSDATVIERRSVDAWGKQRDFDWQNTGPYNPNYRAQLLYTTKAYTGHESIAEVDLIHMNGRVYDAVLARFISADPHIQAASLSQSYNRYSYVMNNPMKYTDPSGYYYTDYYGGDYYASNSRSSRSSSRRSSSRFNINRDSSGSIFSSSRSSSSRFNINLDFLGSRFSSKVGQGVRVPYILNHGAQGRGSTSGQGVRTSNYVSKSSSKSSLNLDFPGSPFSSKGGREARVPYRLSFDPQVGGSIAEGRFAVQKGNPGDERRAYFNNQGDDGKLNSYGVTMEGSIVNPMMSNGGGVLGVNVQYIEGHGWGVYTYTPSATVDSTGFGIGVSAQVNQARGNGVWEGDFNNTDVGLGPVSGGSFNSPGREWNGLTVGGSVGVPITGSTNTTNFIRIWGHDNL